MSESGTKKVKFTRSKRACTTCRQMKLKCDALDKFPKKCSRCLRVGTICEIDSSYKRETAKRSKSSNSPNSDITDESIPKVSENASENTAVQANYENSFFPAIKSSINLMESIIPNDKVTLMFQTFIKYNYQHLPVLSKQLLDPEYLWNKKYTLLFYSICHSTSCICCPELETTLELKLKNLINATDMRYMVDPFHTLSVIYGLLIICYWPLRSTSIQNDESFIHIGKAVDLAMKIGLHRFSYIGEYCIGADNSLKQQIQTATVVWGGCFVTKTFLSSFFGIPSSLPLNYRLYTTLNDVSNNLYIDDFKKQIKLCQFIQTSLNCLGNNPETDFGMVDPLIRGVQHKAIMENLSIIVSEISPCSKYTEMICLHAKLLIHSILLVPDTLEENQASAAMSLYLVCVKIIDTLVSLTQDLVMVPVFVFSISSMAATILYGLSISKTHQSLVNQDITRNSLANFYSVMQKLKRYPNDFATRAMRVIDGLQNLNNRDLIKEPIFTVRSRMGASAFWSLLLTFKRVQVAEQQQQQEQSNNTPTVENFSGIEGFDPSVDDVFNLLWDGDISSHLDSNIFSFGTIN